MATDGKSVEGKANKVMFIKHFPLQEQKTGLRKFEQTPRSFPRSSKSFTVCETVPGMASGARMDLGQAMRCNFQ